MTAILHFTYDTYPVLLGDLLISGPETEKMVNVPTIGQVEKVFPKGSQFVPVKLTQKVNIINKNLAVAWAGKYLDALTIIEILRKEFSENKVTCPKVKEVLRDLSTELNNFDNIALIVLGIENKRPFSFWINAIPKTHSLLNRLIGAGSGAEEILSQIDNFCPLEGVTKDNVNLPQRAVAFSLSLSGLLTQMELYFGSTLSSYFGGGFEIAIINKGEIQKLDDVSFVFWDAKELIPAGYKISIPLKVLKYKYYDDFLFIRSGTLVSNQIRDENIHVVSPLGKTLEQNINKYPIPKLHSKLYCHQVFCRYNNKKTASLTRVNFSAKGEGQMQINEQDDKKIDLFINEELLKGIVALASEVYY